MKYEYRVNLGNGQVHYAGSLEDCLSWLESNQLESYCFIQFRDNDTGDWFTYHGKGASSDEAISR